MADVSELLNMLEESSFQYEDLNDIPRLTRSILYDNSTVANESASQLQRLLSLREESVPQVVLIVSAFVEALRRKIPVAADRWRIFDLITIFSVPSIEEAMCIDRPYLVEDYLNFGKVGDFSGPYKAAALLIDTAIAFLLDEDIRVVSHASLFLSNYPEFSAEIAPILSSLSDDITNPILHSSAMFSLGWLEFQSNTGPTKFELAEKMLREQNNLVRIIGAVYLSWHKLESRRCVKVIKEVSATIVDDIQKYYPGFPMQSGDLAVVLGRNCTF